MRILFAALLLLGVLSGPPAQADEEPTFAELTAAFEKTAGKSLPLRTRALRSLKAHKTSACVRYLDGVRKGDTDRRIRLLALALIGDVGVDPARAILKAVLERGRLEERATGLLALGKLDPPVPAKRFLDVLAASTESVAARWAALRSLGRYPRVDVAQALAGALVDQPRWLKATARESLRQIVGKPPVARWFVRKALARKPLYPDAVPHLLQVASSCGDERVPVLLWPRLRRKKPLEVRVAAAVALGELLADRGEKAGPSLDALAPLLRARQEEVVVAAAAAIGRIGPHGKALNALLKLARSRTAGQRALAIGGLGPTLDPRVVPAAAKALRDQARPVRFAALETLRQQRSKDSVRALIGALRNSEGRFQHELARALRQLTGGAMGDEHADWLAWWSAVENTFRFPDPQAKPKNPKRLESKVRPKYYGNDIVSTRVAFIVDTSGSMAEKTKLAKTTTPVTRLEVCRRELRTVIGGLPVRARFNLLAFSHRFSAWKKRATRASSRVKKEALTFVRDLKAIGGTNIFDPLHEALVESRVDTIWLLSDGEPTSGRLVFPTDILREVRRLNATRRVAIHTISVGQKSELLKRLARENGGTYHER